MADQSDLPELLKIYYKTIFPYKQYFEWLKYGEVGPRPKYFGCREFSFTLENDIYIRYQSFTDQKDMEREIQKKCPYKIDIGAVFSAKPKDNKKTKSRSFQAEEKELVFDIDMTDYDDVRTCCSGASICNRCWAFMTIAMKIIDKALKEDFGYEHRLWVYSGRRGVHCWVCDEAARKLSQNERSAIAEYLTVVKGGENQVKKVYLSSKIHPSLQRASTILEGHFSRLMLESQEILSTKETWKDVLALIPDESIKTELEESWESCSKSSVQRWKELEHACKEKSKKPFNSYCQEIIFQYCYPRLDVNVTKGLNHLLKSPFCIHPKTGRVCVPIDIERVEEFDPLTVPTICQLCDEIDNSARDQETDEIQPSQTPKGYQSVLLESCMRVFERFLQKLHVANKQRSKETSLQEESTDW